jgi:hypothetical protein
LLLDEHLLLFNVVFPNSKKKENLLDAIDDRNKITTLSVG